MHLSIRSDIIDLPFVYRPTIILLVVLLHLFQGVVDLIWVLHKLLPLFVRLNKLALRMSIADRNFRPWDILHAPWLLAHPCHTCSRIVVVGLRKRIDVEREDGVHLSHLASTLHVCNFD